MDALFTTRFPAVAPSDENEQPLDTAAQHHWIRDADFSDEDLMVQVCGGNREALAVLFRRYARLVRTISSRILRDSSEADDVLQEVFLFIHCKCGTFDNSKSSARSWIVQVAYHRAIDRRRYLQSRHFYSCLDVNAVTDLLDRCSEGREQPQTFCKLVGDMTIEGLLDSLSDDQRNTLRLHFVEDFTFAEIAAKLDQSLGNIRNHYYRGLEKLRKQMFPSRLLGANKERKKWLSD